VARAGCPAPTLYGLWRPLRSRVGAGLAPALVPGPYPTRALEAASYIVGAGLAPALVPGPYPTRVGTALRSYIVGAGLAPALVPALVPALLFLTG